MNTNTIFQKLTEGASKLNDYLDDSGQQIVYENNNHSADVFNDLSEDESPDPSTENECKNEEDSSNTLEYKNALARATAQMQNEMKSHIRQKDKVINSFKEKNRAVEKELLEYKRNYDQLSTSFANLEQNMKVQFDEEMSSLRKKLNVEELKANVSRLETELKNSENCRSDLSLKITDLESNVVALESSYLECDRKRQELEECNSGHLRTLNFVNNKLFEAEKKNEILSVELNNLRVRREKDNDKVVRVPSDETDDVSTIITQNLNDEIAFLREKVSTSEKTVEDLLCIKSTSEMEIRQLQGRVKSLEKVASKPLVRILSPMYEDIESGSKYEKRPSLFTIIDIPFKLVTGYLHRHSLVRIIFFVQILLLYLWLVFALLYTIHIRWDNYDAKTPPYLFFPNASRSNRLILFFGTLITLGFVTIKATETLARRGINEEVDLMKDPLFHLTADELAFKRMMDDESLRRDVKMMRELKHMPQFIPGQCTINDHSLNSPYLDK